MASRIGSRRLRRSSAVVAATELVESVTVPAAPVLAVAAQMPSSLAFAAANSSSVRMP
jgi:hypothetical protein